jgi:outer membrane protein with beta-barrel domain
MKKLSLVMAGALGLLSLQGLAQSQDVQAGGTTFGIRAGVNLQNINGRDAGDDKLENKLAPRFHVGVNAEIPVAPDFYVQPGLMFSTKGAKIEEGFGGSPKLNLSYIELPINFLYKPTLGSGKLLVGFGPYFAYGIGGKLKTDGDDTDVKFKGTVKAGDDPDVVYFKPFDAGANILFGYEFANRFSAQLNVQLGLVNINSDYDAIPDTDARSANTGFGVSVGYRF